jgi:hypothetical protein
MFYLIFIICTLLSLSFPTPTNSHEHLIGIGLAYTIDNEMNPYATRIDSIIELSMAEFNTQMLSKNLSLTSLSDDTFGIPYKAIHTIDELVEENPAIAVIGDLYDETTYAMNGISRETTIPVTNTKQSKKQTTNSNCNM